MQRTLFLAAALAAMPMTAQTEEKQRERGAVYRCKDVKDDTLHYTAKRLKGMECAVISYVIRPRPQQPVPTFAGYKCRGDCSGHIAGWRWASEKNLAFPSQCAGHSTSFIEGCLAYFQD